MARSAAPLAALLMLSFLLVPRPALSALSCSLAVQSIDPCTEALTKGDPIPPLCCIGLKSLIAEAKTTADRQTACSCLKKAVGLTSGIQPDFSFNIPPDCGFNIPFPISASADCSKVV